jgi:hypothetical protein
MTTTLLTFSKQLLLQVIQPPAYARPFVKAVQIRDSSSQYWHPQLLDVQNLMTGLCILEV